MYQFWINKNYMSAFYCNCYKKWIWKLHQQCEMCLVLLLDRALNKLPLIGIVPYILIDWLICFSGRIPRLLLIQHSLYVEVVEKAPPHHSQGSSTERWSRNTLTVVTAKVFYVLGGSLTSPFIFNNSGETAASFNVVNHPRCCEPRN